MKNLILNLILTILFLVSFSLKAQIDSLEGFDEKHALEHLIHIDDENQKLIILNQMKREWINSKYYLGHYQNAIKNSFKLFNQDSILQGPQPSGCNNIDFESGNISGWSVSGYHQIMSGTGTDPHGGFPVVYPGGNFSLKLSGDWSASADNCNCGNSSMGNFCFSTAQKIISVSSTHPELDLHFAFVVYNYPHSPSDAAYVEIKILDPNGNQLSCPYFKVYYSNGQFYGLNGLTPQYGGNVSGCTGNHSVTYLPWTTVNIDLSSYIGQNVTLVVTVRWCIYNVDWAYAYIDADCVNSTYNIPPGCPNENICAPAGFASYNWSIPGGGSASGQCITASTPGVYTVVCQPMISCLAPKTVTINVVNPFIPQVTTNSVSCNGGSDGSASVSISGGTPPFSYTWSPIGGNNSSAVGLSAGNYTLTIKDASCTLSQTFQIVEPPALSLTATQTQSVSCNGGNNGIATSNPSGGVGGYTYTWSPSGGNNQIANGLTAGIYTVSVQDANACSITQTVQIVEPPALSLTATQTQSVSCNGGNNGGATSNPSGGVGGYTYTWSPSGGNSQTASSLTAGIYTVSVQDANACSITQTVQIVEPPALSLTATQTQSVSCNGGNNGIATSNPSGGVGGYTYTWSPTGGNNQIANGLTAGIYTVSVQDANACSITQTVQIVEPPALSLTATQTQSVSCNGGNNGIATSNPSGGVGGYTYTWSPSGGNNQTASGLTMGIYTITISDANLCGPISATVEIKEPPALSITVSGQSVTCYGYANGSATANVSGGVGGYSYTWTPGNANTPVVSGLLANTYTVSVLDANHCFISASINIPQPSSVGLVTTPNQTICYGNSANILANANGGTPPYTYNWNNGLPNSGGPHLVTLTSTTIYTVQAVDAQNCVSPINTIKITVLPPLLATGMGTTVCDGHSAVIYPTVVSPGNGGPYNYLWSNMQSAATINVVGNYALGSPNMYTVVISDGCSVPDAVAEVTVNVNPNPVISFSANPVKGCVPLTVVYDGVSDGANDVFVWSFGNGQSGNGSNATTTYTSVGLFTPTLVVTNSYGCVSTSVIPNYIETYPLPVADFEADPWGTSIVTPLINFINTSVGASSYLWNFGDYGSPTNTTTVVNPSHEYMYSGTYTVTLIATSDKGCKSYIAKAITIDPEFHLYIPNVFTPDGNGLNDVFQPKGVGIDETDYKMLIFDRWGELIFESNNFQKGWDGSVKNKDIKAKEDVYVYKIYVRDLKGNKHEFVGHVTCLPYMGDK